MGYVVACLFVAFGLFPAASVAAPDRVALVMGNGAYTQAGALANPVNDAEAMADALEHLGFDVILETDVDRRGAYEAMESFTRAADGAEISVFFFAGHGLQIGGENFLLPVDVVGDSEWSIRSSAIEAQRIVAEMERRSNVSIAILDACRDNPLVDIVAQSGPSSRSVRPERGLGPMRLSGRGAIIAFAAAAGDVAADGTGDHSPFTKALLEEIGEPNVEIGLMFRRVSRRVRDETRGDQHPELLVRLVDEVYLNRTEEQPAVVAAAATPAPTAAAPSEAAPLEVASAENGRQVAAPGREASSDKQFFGTRVIHTPAWANEVAIPQPSGWRSAAPTPVTETPENNSFANAQEVPLAAAVEARITPRGDKDWFRVFAPSAGELRVDVDPAPGELDVNAQVLDADAKVVAGWQGSGGNGKSFFGGFPIAQEGWYWIQLADGNNDAESATAFTATIDFIAADDPFEPNNTLGAAVAIPSTVRFAPAIYPRGDNDWYKLWVAEPGLLQVTTANVSEDLDVHVRVRDLNNTDVRGWVGPPRKGGDTLLDAELPAPGTYLVQVADGNNDAAAVETFDLDVAFSPVSDAAEPNNSFSEAVIVPPTGERKMAIFPRGDNDWLAIDVDHPGELYLLAANSPENLDIHFRVLNPDNGAMLGWTGPARTGGDVEAIADLPAPGRYFINVADGNNDASSPDLFDFEIAFTEQPDQYEPNNGPRDAAPLTIGGEILFNILPRGDNDWFRVEVPIAGELAIVIDEVAENLDVHYRVLDADRKDVVGWTGPPRKGGVTEGIVDLPGAGVYYLNVADGNNDARAIEHATLATAFTPIAETIEPNNTFGNAVPLTLGEPHLATILPRGDEDWYLLEAPRAGSFVVTIDTVDENLDVYVQLVDADAKAGSWFGPPRKGGVTEAEIAVPAAGLYRLRVADGNNDARSPQPFRLQVDFK